MSDKESNKWKQMQDRSVWENSVRPLLGIAMGTQASIIRILGISLKEDRLNYISDKLDLFAMVCVELGMETQKSDKKDEIMQRIRWIKERMSEE